MNKRNSRKKMAARKTTTKRKPAPKKERSLGHIKQYLNSIFVWVLVVVNVVLIASMIQKLLQSPSAPSIQSDIEYGEPLKIEILNGCGVTGLANEFGDFLQRQRVDVVNIGNAPTYDYDKSIVIDRGRKDQKQIRKLCQTLGVDEARILKINNNELQVDATFIIGADYADLKSYQSLH